jgi:tRNA G18 (ribose-2'-O)-methylase SpoU
VAPIIPVEDPDDPRLADYVRLRDVSLRRSLEAAHGLFVAEGEKVIRRAAAAGYPLRSFLTIDQHLGGLADLIDRCPAPVYVVTDEVVERLTGFAVHRGALASCQRLPLPSVAELTSGARRTAFAGSGARCGVPAGRRTGPAARGAADPAPDPRPARRVVVLEDLVDHGNVGGIFRCAAALGVDAVILSPRCADPLYRRSVKVSMGAVFAIPYARMTDWYRGLADLRAEGFQLLALTPDQSAAALDEAPMGERVALLLGSEGDGLSSRWLQEADQAVCIRMARDAMELGVDSLNVVAAAAIACHGLMRGSRLAL